MNDKFEQKALEIAGSLDEVKKLGAELVTPRYSPTGEDLGSDALKNVDFTDPSVDVSKPAKVFIGQYLSSTTKEKKNFFPISSPPAAENFQSTQPSTRGNKLAYADQNGQRVFAPGSSTITNLKSYGLGVHTQQKVSLSSFFEQDQIEQFLDKTGGSTEVSGNTLLSNVPTATPKSAKTGNPFADKPEGNTKSVLMLQYVHDQLVEGNMYSPDSDPTRNSLPFLKDQNSKDEEVATQGLFTIQRNLGKFVKNSSENDPSGTRVKVSDMSAMAMSLMLKSSNDTINANVIFSSKDLSKMVARDFLLRPELVKPVGVSVLDLRLSSINPSATGQQDILNAAIISDSSLVNAGTLPNNQNISGIPKLQSSARNAVTRQHLNSFLEPFDETFSLGMLGLAAAGVLSAILAALVLSAIVQGLSALFGAGGTASLQANNPSSLRYGRRESSAAFGGDTKITDVISELLQAADTDNAYTKCVPAGLALLFGFPNVDPTQFSNVLRGGLNALVDVALNLVLSPGYYANFLRTIVSDNAEIAASFKNIGSANNFSGGLASTFKAVSTIINSKLYKFLMISAALGDVSLKSLHGSRGVGENERMLTKKQQASLSTDAMFNANGIPTAQLGMYRMQISRWGSNDKSIPSLSLKTFVASQIKPSSFGVSIDKGEGIESKSRLRFLSPGRSSVQLVENSIEAEYMPFYIHDLRTHEIISMPAFITDFSETFNANYNSIKGIGRQDPVRIYQDTERTVTFGFILAAFTEEDHAHLWYTINRFVAMCYPQYSSGKLRKIEDSQGDVTQFIQPFSQIQAASPMVRLRLGDVFKSNYSKFGLARLFGINSSALTTGPDISELAKKSEEAKKKYRDAYGKARDRIKQRYSNVNSGIASAATSLPSGTIVRLRLGTFLTLFGETAANTINPAGETVPPGVTISSNDEVFAMQIIKYLPGSTIAEGKYLLQFINPNMGSSQYTVPRGSFAAGPFASAEPGQGMEKEIENDPEVKAAQSEIDRLEKLYPSYFFSAKDNAVIRSFESNRGRGVAGFITSVGLQYDPSYPWETEPGKRAPKIVKISLGFAPITDLPLGLDYDGHMRNPSHPVGEIAGSFGDVYSEMSSLNNAGAGVNFASHNFGTVWGKENNGIAIKSPDEDVTISNDTLGAIMARKKSLTQ